MKPFRDGKHFLSRTRPGVIGEEVDIVKMRLAYDDRIDRMIPALSRVVKPRFLIPRRRIVSLRYN